MAFEPHYPQRHGRPGLQITCEKRGHLFISQHSFIKKKRENLIFLVKIFGSDSMVLFIFIRF